MYLGIIGKRFGDGGLRDLLVQSEVLAEGSVDRALSGKTYNRAARSVKIVYEALSRLLLDDFHDQTKEKDEQKEIIDNVMIMMRDFSSNINQTNLDTILNSETFSQYNIMWIDYLDGLKENGSELTQYWLSYLDMARILLNLLCAARAGLWHLFPETIRDVIPYCFAYDNINYSRYLTVMLADMTAVENDFPDVYQQFCNGHFTTQLSEHPFSRMEPDKVIEVTINKETKCHGGTSGFSRKSHAVKRWALTSAYRAELRKMLYGYVNYAPQKFPHKDLTSSRIMKDERDIQSVLEVVNNVFINLFSDNDLLCISNGLVATDEVKYDLLTAREKGIKAMVTFHESHLASTPEQDFFTPIKKLQLKTFTIMKKKVKITINNKVVPIKSHSNLFGQLALIMQTREINLQNVFSFPLGLYPWALSGVMGELKKYNKASLLHTLENGIDPMEDEIRKPVTILDGMSIVHKTRVRDRTFAQLADAVLQTIIALGESSDVIHLVFDVNQNESIKNAERVRRGDGSLLFQKLVPSQVVSVD